MNELIKRLAEQADSYARYDYTYPEDLSEHYHMIFEKKFADLIIQECIKACHSRVGNSDYNTGRMHCISDIKQQLGVQ